MPGLPAGPGLNQLGDRSTTVCKLQIRPSLAGDVVQPCCRDDKRSRNSNRSGHTSTRHSPAANTRHQRHTEGMDRCCCVFLPTSRLTLTQTCRPHQPATELEGRLLTLQKKGEEMHSLGGTIQSPCAARCLSKKDEKWPAAPLTVQNSPGESNTSTQRHFQRHKNQRFLSAGPTEQL